jgi:hypothetical protein
MQSGNAYSIGAENKQMTAVTAKTGNLPRTCENCGKGLYTARLGNQCLYCGHRSELISAQFTRRAIQFLVANSLVWLAVAFEVFRLNAGIGLVTTAATAFCLFGGLLLRRWLSMKGDWIAVALTALMVFLFLHAATPQ